VNTAIRNLAKHLSEVGVPLKKIPGCVRDLGCLVAENPSVDPLDLSAAMGRKGWKDFRADDQILLLVLLIIAETLIEADPGKRLWFDHRVRKWDPALPAH